MSKHCSGVRLCFVAPLVRCMDSAYAHWEQLCLIGTRLGGTPNILGCRDSMSDAGNREFRVRRWPVRYSRIKASWPPQEVVTSRRYPSMQSSRLDASEMGTTQGHHTRGQRTSVAAVVAGANAGAGSLLRRASTGRVLSRIPQRLSSEENIKTGVGSAASAATAERTPRRAARCVRRSHSRVGNTLREFWAMSIH